MQEPGQISMMSSIAHPDSESHYQTNAEAEAARQRFIDNY